MGDPGHGLPVAKAAARMGVAKSTARGRFDASGGTAGTTDPETGRRLFDPAWVEAQVVRRAARSSLRVPGSLSVAEVSAALGVGKTTVRKWFDRDRPGSGAVVEGGRTGGTERRCSPAWVRGLEEALGRTKPPSG